METTAGWIAPQLATSGREPFDDAGWLFERKLDGVRVIAVGDGQRIRLWSRNHNNISASYPEIVSALEENLDSTPFVLDGEVVALDIARGDYGDFGLLQRRIHLTDRRRIERTKVAVEYAVFDLLHFDGHDARRLPLTSRKALLDSLPDWTGPLTVVGYTFEHGVDAYRQAVDYGWEGVVAKRANAPYKSGRSSDWLKIKAVRGQEFVVGGCTAPTGSRSGFGALLVGYYDGEHLRYAGRVGSGFSEDDLGRLHPMLESAVVTESPFVDAPRVPGARWVEPRLVVQVRFNEWTSAGRLRAPVYQGVRDDKDPATIIREP